jgi:sodium-coupled monocarboxylate transporter 8/12
MTYTTALLLRDISGIPMGYSIAIMGGVTMLYTVTGGMAAVVWTDVLQFFVFMIGIFAIAGIVAWRVGGVDDVFAVAYAHDKLHVIGDLGLDFHKRLTFWGLLIGVSFVNLDYYAVDQMVLQRYFSSKDKSQSRRALIFNACFSPLFGFLLYFIGLGLFAFYLKYSSVAQAMPDDQKVLPYFIVNEIPRGLAGLIVAAVFAATMSSISSGLNSLATTTVVDFHERLHGRPADAKDAVRVSRIATLAYGVFILLIAYLIAVYWESPKVIELTYRLSNPFTGVILGLFLIGLFTRRVPGIPAVIGGVVGLVVVGYVVFCTDISFLWYSAASCMTTILVTALLSPFFRPQPRETLVDLTVYDRTTR